MKKLIKSFSALLALTLVFAGCSSDDIKQKEDELKKIEENVVDSVKSTQTHAKEDIEEATNFIEENIDKVKDGEVAKKIAEYGAYLEKIAKNEEKEVSHDLAKFGKEAKELAQKVYTAAEDEKDEIIKDSEASFKNWGTKLSEEKDKLVDEFHKLINH